MSQMIPEKYMDLLEKPAFGNLGTLMKDGSPQVTPIWVDYDGKFVRFNSAKGRVKDKNIRRDPRVSVAIQDPANPYRYLEIRGKVVEITETARDDHINKLSKNIWEIQFTLSGNQAKCASLTRSNRKKSVPWASASTADSDSYIKFCILRLTTDNRPLSTHSRAATRAAMRPSAVRNMNTRLSVRGTPALGTSN